MPATIARRHGAGLAVFAILLGVVVAVPALSADPAGADRRTETRCDFDPISGLPFNCREVEIAHTHPTEPKPLPTALPCGAPSMPRDADCDDVDDQLNTGTAPDTSEPDTSEPDTSEPDTDEETCETNPSMQGCDPCTANPSLPQCDPCTANPSLPQCDPCTANPSLPQCDPCNGANPPPECRTDPPPPPCSVSSVATVSHRHASGAHSGCQTHARPLCRADAFVWAPAGHAAVTVAACPDPETYHEHSDGQGHTGLQRHTRPGCGPLAQTWAPAGHLSQAVEACPVGFATEPHRHPAGEGHTDLQAHSPEPQCWSVALSSFPGHGHDPIPVPVCPSGWHYCADTTDGMNPRPPGSTCPRLTAAEAVLASALQQAAAPGWVAQNWNAPGLVSHIGAALDAGVLTPAQQIVMRYVQAGVEAAEAERNREHKRNPVAVVVRPGDPAAIAQEVWASLPAEVRAPIAGLGGVVIKISQDHADAVCAASDQAGGLVGAVAGTAGLTQLVGNPASTVWVARAAAVVGTGATVTGGALSVAWLYCEFVYTPSGANGGALSRDSSPSTDETLVIMIPLLLDDGTATTPETTTPTSETTTEETPIIDTCAEAAALTEADLASAELVLAEEHYADANYASWTVLANGDTVIPAAGITHARLSGERFVAGSVLESVTIAAGSSPDFTTGGYEWTGDEIAEVTLAAACTTPPATTTPPPTSTVPVPRGDE